MRRCRVSMTGEDGEEHALETEAASLMDAAYAGVQAWAKTSWWRPEGVLEVRSGEQCWRVKKSRASPWYSERFRNSREGGGP